MGHWATYTRRGGRGPAIEPPPVAVLLQSNAGVLSGDTGLTGGSGFDFLAGRYTASAAWRITQVVFRLFVSAGATGVISCNRHADSAGLPGAVVTTTTALPYSVVPTVLGSFTLGFFEFPVIPAGTNFWLSLPAPTSGTLHWEFNATGSGTIFTARRLTADGWAGLTAGRVFWCDIYGFSP